MPPLSIESVDPNLQSVAVTALHWRKITDHRYELHQPDTAPALDGMGKPVTRLLAVLRYDAKTDMYFGYVHQQPGLQTGEPDMHVCSRFLLPMAQEQIYNFLRDIKRL